MRDTVLQIVPARAASFDALPTLVRAVLRLCDGTRPVSAILALSPLKPDATERVLRRLAERGYVVARQQPPPARRPLEQRSLEWARDRPGGAAAGFSAAEEAFFQSGIDHLVGDEFYE